MVSLGIFELPLFTNVILPFVLMFVVVFAILEKTDILGKDKRQINALVAFVFALVFVSVPSAVGVTQNIIPIIGVVIIILLSFMMLIGFLGFQTGEKGVNRGLKIALGIMIGIVMIGIIIWATGMVPVFQGWFSVEEFLSSFVLIIFIIAIFAIVLTSKTEGEGKGK